MDTTVDALKNVYVAEGGNIEDVQEINTIPDMLNAIATVIAAKNDGGN